MADRGGADGDEPVNLGNGEGGIDDAARQTVETAERGEAERGGRRGAAGERRRIDGEARNQSGEFFFRFGCVLCGTRDVRGW
jgi:hypothetical protein